MKEESGDKMENLKISEVNLIILVGGVTLLPNIGGVTNPSSTLNLHITEIVIQYTKLKGNLYFMP